MRPSSTMEIVFESTLEARVAAQLLNDAGRSDLVSRVTPPIEQPSIGRIEFAARLGDSMNGKGDNAEYRVPTADSIEVVRILGEEAQFIHPDKVTASRKKWMGHRLLELAQKTAELKTEVLSDLSVKPRIIDLGGLRISGNISDEEVDFLKRREAFVNRYLDERGWEVNSISVEQLLEVRSQPEWQNPPEIGQ